MQAVMRLVCTGVNTWHWFKCDLSLLFVILTETVKQTIRLGAKNPVCLASIFTGLHQKELQRLLISILPGARYLPTPKIFLFFYSWLNGIKTFMVTALPTPCFQVYQMAAYRSLTNKGN